MNYRRTFSISLLVTALILGAASVYAEPLPGGHADATATVSVAPAALHQVSVHREASLDVGTVNPPSIPEPATAILVGVTLLGVGTIVRRRRAA
ncbi:MAG TPA: PEP-CTERM sorting domain-containing protein [Planctomycetota bacterium]|nr:PEP-CTERM sorting domain-containing protein [Planctomycetota bacterium]